MIYIDIVCVENYLAVECITSQKRVGPERGVGAELDKQINS
ncbi:MAG: hypothetical protein WC784_02285 [Candidatus Shapirobacteria bacterium]|jgi:hypothetical protein